MTYSHFFRQNEFSLYSLRIKGTATLPFLAWFLTEQSAPYFSAPSGFLGGSGWTSRPQGPHPADPFLSVAIGLFSLESALY